MNDPEALELLTEGDITVEGRMPYSSNATLLVTIEHEGRSRRAVYKPIRGERPLRDFPAGLAYREQAAYELSAALGWELVPPTVVRAGPFGDGSVQWFIDADFSQHYFTLREQPEHDDALRRLCVFDLVANSTDRKGGHLLVDAEGHIWAIDNGLSFHRQFKVRTVLWDFAGEPIEGALMTDLGHLVDDDLPPRLASLLNPPQQEALRQRVRAILADGHFPHDHTGHAHPWPLV